ncbi:hypothetical protein mRhiFer1_008520 [Rhinolophus ferrumequinum]|uniref:Uncharacterized protein n=1 Tax=Rhinolophus ferrumequinum TaxID=59479 RepID=A0A7J7UX17_RHIFE|nr:hypothetical protein mRhiFer1_008520 [Rhinolophus ferrumequinum]
MAAPVKAGSAPRTEPPALSSQSVGGVGAQSALCFWQKEPSTASVGGFHLMLQFVVGPFLRLGRNFIQKSLDREVGPYSFRSRRQRLRPPAGKGSAPKPIVRIREPVTARAGGHVFSGCLKMRPLRRRLWSANPQTAGDIGN